MDQALSLIDEWVKRRERHYVCTVDVHALMESHSAPDVREIYRSAGIAAPDGMPLIWLLHRSGHREADRICGPDLMPALFRRSPEHGYRHYLYGSSEQTLVQLIRVLNDKYPGATIAGTYSPPFRSLTPAEDEQVNTTINAAEPDIVWVGLGAPKQDRWMAAHRSGLNAPVMIGVGGAFEMMAGTVRRAPRFVRKTGFEWTFRLMQEPRRLGSRYLESNSKFVMMLLKEKLRIGTDRAGA
jgi:N-acetylglucosaminyldiphosphoundecaprenol N-acetyl-beta-D-mannosaminyltransferase